jgi:hypothetical protein
VSESDPTIPEPHDGPSDAHGRGVRVEGYEGLRAGEAVVAVRRLGLRPSLERVEGYGPEIQGFVVSQDPVEGTLAQPDSPVCLFVAAPSRTVAAGDSPPEVEEPETGEPDEPESRETETGEPDFDVESFHVGEPLYADETVELYEVAAPTDRPPEPHFASEKSDRPGDDRESLATDDERPPEVWRGPPSSPRRTQLRSRGARRPARAHAGPWGLGGAVHWGALVLSVLVAVVLLMVLATHGRPVSRERSPSHAPSPVAAGASPDAGSRPQDSLARCHSACNHAGLSRRAAGARRSLSRRAHRVRTVGTQTVAPAHDSSPVAPGAGASSAPVEATGASAEEHAAMEFGP